MFAYKLNQKTREFKRNEIIYQLKKIHFFNILIAKCFVTESSTSVAAFTRNGLKRISKGRWVRKYEF